MKTAMGLDYGRSGLGRAVGEKLRQEEMAEEDVAT